MEARTTWFACEMTVYLPVKQRSCKYPATQFWSGLQVAIIGTKDAKPLCLLLEFNENRKCP